MVGGLWAVCLASAGSVDDASVVSEASLCRDTGCSGSSGPGVAGRRLDISTASYGTKERIPESLLSIFLSFME